MWQKSDSFSTIALYIYLLTYRISYLVVIKPVVVLTCKNAWSRLRPVNKILQNQNNTKTLMVTFGVDLANMTKKEWWNSNYFWFGTSGWCNAHTVFSLPNLSSSQSVWIVFKGELYTNKYFHIMYRSNYWTYFCWFYSKHVVLIKKQIKLDNCVLRTQPRRVCTALQVA